DGGGSYFLPNLIGPYLAKELLFSAEPLSAERAHALGIINHVYPVDAFERECTAFATRIANGPSATFGFIKKLVDQSLITNLEKYWNRNELHRQHWFPQKITKKGYRLLKKNANLISGIQIRSNTLTYQLVGIII